MKSKYTLTLLIMYIVLNQTSIYANSDSGKVKVETKKAQIDFKEESFTAEDGVKFIYPNKDPKRSSKMEAKRLKKVKDKNIIIAEDVNFAQGQNHVEAESLIFNIDSSDAKMTDALSYVLVDGAQKGHERLYYGGEKITASFPTKAYVQNAWFTTSKKALLIENGDIDPKEVLPYHIKAKKIDVYPGKKIVAHNLTLYAGSVPVFWLPWYATSLKAETKAPLFPYFGSDSKEGFYIIWGLDYGYDSDYFNGSAALKFADKKGWMIESWENVYKLGGDKDNKGKFGLYETLFFAKGDYEDQYKFEHTHEYKGKYGTFEWKYLNQTLNTINAVEDAKDDYEDGSEPDNPYANLKQEMQRYQLKTDLVKLGPSEDISIKADLQYISNKEAASELINDAIDDLANDIESDNDLKTDVMITKENELYKLMVHSDYLDDLDPGSNKEDTSSKKDNMAYGVKLKKYKIDFKYSEKDEDIWRALTTNERSLDGETLKDKKGLAYNPYTVKKWDNTGETYNLSLGSYEIFNSGIGISFNHLSDTSEKELSRELDPFRLNDYTGRDQEYNRDEDILYDKKVNEKSDIALNYKSNNVVFGFGNLEENYIDRSNNDAGDEYSNNSDFKEYRYYNNAIDLHRLGNLSVDLSRREDNFTRDDMLTNDKYSFNYDLNIYNNKDYFMRSMDLSLDNSMRYSFSEFRHDVGGYNFGASDSILEVHDKDDLAKYRLNGKRNIKNIGDTLNFGLGNTNSIYSIDSKNQYDSFITDWQTDKDLIQSLEFKIDNKRSASITYGTYKDYAKNDNDPNANLVNNDFSEKYWLETDNKTLAVELADDNHKIYYSNSKKHHYDRAEQKLDPGTGLANETTSHGKLLSDDYSEVNSYGYEYSKEKEYKILLKYKTQEDIKYNFATNSLDPERYRDTYEIETLFGDKTTHLFKLKYETFRNKVDSFYNTKEYEFRYEYVNKEDESMQEKVSYIDGNGDHKLTLSRAEMEGFERKYREEQRKKHGVGFDLMNIGDFEDDIIYKNYATLYLQAVSNDDYRKKSSDFTKSVKDYQVRAEFHRGYYKLEYKYDQEVNFTLDNTQEYGIKREVVERLHELEATTRFGKEDYLWSLKGKLTYKEEVGPTEKELDGWLVSIGKEFEFMEVALEHEQQWNENNREYDWTWRVKFSLLTFPDKGINLGNKYENGRESIDFGAGM